MNVIVKANLPPVTEAALVKAVASFAKANPTVTTQRTTIGGVAGLFQASDGLVQFIADGNTAARKVGGNRVQSKRDEKRGKLPQGMSVAKPIHGAEHRTPEGDFNQLVRMRMVRVHADGTFELGGNPVRQFKTREALLAHLATRKGKRTEPPRVGGNPPPAPKPAATKAAAPAKAAPKKSTRPAAKTAKRKR